MVKHVLGISGGKDSAALAIYLRGKYPSLDIEYYTCDTGKELNETYELVERLKSVLGKDILLLKGVDNKDTVFDNPFDHFLAEYNGFLPSNTARWCTKKMKLEPFENYLGDAPTISYVGIRGDEDREGYISKKSNVQSIFPFRKNIWSEDVIRKVLDNKNIEILVDLYQQISGENSEKSLIDSIRKPISLKFKQKQKLNKLLEANTVLFNNLVFAYCKKYTEYPIAQLDNFPLVENDEILVLDDIFSILEDSGVGIPAYYNERDYEVEIDDEVKKGKYSRSRSGCFFCFFQQKIEWVWLLEKHPKLYAKAIEYEKDGYSWMDTESLEELSKPERVNAIKKEHYLRMQRNAQKDKSSNWIEQLKEAEGVGCSSCFI